MCGRTACTLEPDCICKAATYRRKDSSTYCLPEWKHLDDKYHVYRPSTNIAPTEVLPAIISGHQLGKTTERIIVPMIWGMIPPWHKGDYRTHGLTTHNIRDDNLFLSKLYLPVFKQSNRCVVLCDGFYEWKRETEGGRGKQPYFIYMPQPEGINISDRNTWNIEWTEGGGWKGPRLMALAGLYNIWVSPEGEKIYSCSVFTTTPNEELKYIHHRIPVVLESDEAIEMWLDVAGKAPIDAVALLKAPKLLVYHPVSNIVNNSRNKDEECTKPIDPNRPKLGASAALMESWLKQRYGSLKRPEDNTVTTEMNDDAKRVKVAEQQQQQQHHQQEQQPPQLQVQQPQDVNMTEQEEDEEMEDEEEEDEDEDIEDEDEVAEEEEDEEEEAVDDEENNDDEEDEDEVMEDEEEEDEDEEEEDDEIEEEEEENSVKMEPESDVAASSGDEERVEVAGSGILTTSAELCSVTPALETEDLPPTTDMCTDDSDVLDTQ